MICVRYMAYLLNFVALKFFFFFFFLKCNCSIKVLINNSKDSVHLRDLLIDFFFFKFYYHFYEKYKKLLKESFIFPFQIKSY